MNVKDERIVPSIDLHGISQWFAAAVPSPTDKNRSMQIGVHFEEVGEMVDAIGAMPFANLTDLTNFYKRNVATFTYLDRKELLDSLCDQIVTAVGIAHMFGLNINRAINKVNRSNWSKFDENGKPIFSPEGKIAKGPNYRAPDLSDCL